MAHPNQIRFCEYVKKKFPSFFINKRVLDVGSLDINGNNRYLFNNCEYIGVDLGRGKNVDIVSPIHQLNLPSNYFDVIISTETFEHDRHYIDSINSIIRMLKTGGLFLFTCASTGRGEHGTSRSRTIDSPFTLDYYKNLTEYNFISIEAFNKYFRKREFITDLSIDNRPEFGTDLYFYGFKYRPIYFICDDVNEREFYKLEQLREKYMNFKVNCFVMGKDAGDYLKQDWVEVGVHGWEHTYPPECERPNQEEYIIKGLNALRKYLPKKFSFRAPGFQLTALSYPILKKLGFSYIAHQYRLQSLIEKKVINGEIINTHIYDKEFGELNGDFSFISEGFDRIVIPVKYRADLLRVCLDSIVAYTPEEYELILVLDGEKYEDFAFIENYNAKILSNETTLGFPATVNKGIIEAKGEYIMVLNLDTVATPGWLGEMLKAFEIDKDIGMVGPTFCETGGSQHIDHNKKGIDYVQCDQIMGVCMFFRRSMLCEIGLFDEKFGLGGGEDMDMAMRVKVAGYKTIIARKSFIYHYGSASFREEFNNDIPYSKKYASNQFFKFKRKWEKELGDKPRIYIGIPNNGWIHPELAIRLIEWSHDSEISIHVNMPIGLSPLDNARNTLVKDMLEDYFSHLLFIDNDIIPPPNALRELLASGKDIIAPLCFAWRSDDKGQSYPMPVAHKYDSNGQYRPYYGKGIEETDIITGGMFLAKRAVYEKMERPFAFTYHANGTVIYSEDFYFSQQAQKLGYKLYTHYGLLCKHFKTIDIREVNNLMVGLNR